jgi:putative ABC transport system permease protein
LTCALLIYLWIYNELHMDRIFRNEDRIWQVMQRSLEDNNTIGVYEFTPAPLAKGLVNEMPEVQYAATVLLDPNSGKGVLRYENKELRATEQYAGKDYFKIFSYPLLYGTSDNVLGEVNNVVISDQLAMKMFNTTENLVGKKLEWKKQDTGTYVISGVFVKPVYNSSMDFDVVFTFDSYRFKKPFLDNWGFNSPSTYILLKENANASELNRKLRTYLLTKSSDTTVSLFMRKYGDRYLYGKFDNGVQAGGRISYVHLFTIVAFFILVIACVNFMNLSTAKAAQRMKEVGIKKAMGARRKSLALQFMGESLLMAFIALLFSIALVALFYSEFEVIVGKPLALDINGGLILDVLGITVITGLMAGSYPAFYLSGFKSATALKGKFINSVNDMLVRKGLVVFQFVISAVLIVSVLVVYKQIKFVQSVNLGFDKDNVIVFRKEGSLNTGMSGFLQQVRGIPGVLNASIMDEDLITNYSGTDDVQWPGKTAGNKIVFKDLAVGFDFVETMGIRMAQGRSFDSPSDTSGIIFNETAIRTMGIKDPIGTMVTQWGKRKMIVGVAKDFHFESLYEPIKPCFLMLNPKASNVLIKIRQGMERNTISQLQAFYHEFNPGFPFDFKFISQDYQTLYDSEIRTATLSWYFAGITILISCLGLFGLAAFTAQKRQKEIGIRKVIGASVTGVVFLLTREILILALIALAMALPLAWWLTHLWLDGFAYRIDIGAGVFLTTGALIILLTLLTISYHAIRSAIANPIGSLRSE